MRDHRRRQHERHEGVQKEKMTGSAEKKTNHYRMYCRTRGICAAIGAVFLAAAVALTVVFAVRQGHDYLVLCFMLCYILALLCFALVFGVQYRSFAFEGHTIEIYIGGKTYRLISDGTVLDEHKALLVLNFNLRGMVEGKIVDVFVSSGVFAPHIALYIDGVRRADFK